MTSTHALSPFAETKTSATRQVATTVLGEVAATVVSIGAVYVKDHLFPGQTAKATSAFAKMLGCYRGTSQEAEQALARKILDVSAMHLGGLANMLTQFTLHRAQQPEDRRTPLLYEAGRVLFGRAAGMVTSIGALALAESQTPALLRSGEAKIESAVSAIGKLGGIDSDQKANARLSELLASSLVQSAGAVVGNAPAQLLFDRLFQPSGRRV